jgi:hypothetical protein
MTQWAVFNDDSITVSYSVFVAKIYNLAPDTAL